MLRRVARSVARLGHGGSIAIVPSGSENRHKYIEANARDAAEPYQVLTSALAHSYEARQRRELGDLSVHANSLWSEEEAQARVEQSIDEIAMLTTIDGAVVLDTQLRVLSFGAKLAASRHLATVSVVEPLRGTEARDVPIDHIGGMRHQSAAKFVADTDDASAIVVSQDGPISIFGREDGQVTQFRGVELLRG